MKVLFLHEVSYREKPIYEMHELPEHLALRGHEVAFVDFVEGESSLRGNALGEHIPGRAVKGSKILLFSQKAKLPGLIGRLLAVLSFRSFFTKILQHFEPDLVVSYSVPTTGWQSLRLCKEMKIPFVFRALDVSHKIRKTNFSRLVKIAEQYIYRRADWLSANNQAMLHYCQDLGASISKSSVELPPLDLTHFGHAPLDEERLRTALGIPQSRRVILYMGSFFYFSGLDSVLKSLAEASSKPHFLLIGGGEQMKELENLVSELGLEEYVTFTGMVPFQSLPQYLSLADVTINPMKPSLVSHKALPNKILQYMASSKPAVSTRLEGLSSLFANQSGVVMVNNPSEIVPAAIELIERGDLRMLGQANRETVIELFDQEETVTTFESRLVKVRGDLKL